MTFTIPPTKRNLNISNNETINRGFRHVFWSRRILHHRVNRRTQTINTRNIQRNNKRGLRLLPRGNIPRHHPNNNFTNKQSNILRPIRRFFYLPNQSNLRVKATPNRNRLLNNRHSQGARPGRPMPINSNLRGKQHGNRVINILKRKRD